MPINLTKEKEKKKKRRKTTGGKEHDDKNPHIYYPKRPQLSLSFLCVSLLY